MAKKLKFGAYAIEASVQISDEIDLDEHFTKAEWDGMSVTEQGNWIRSYIQDMAIADLFIDYDSAD